MRDQLSEALGDIESQIEAVAMQAEELGISAYELRDASGGWVLAPLLAAKASLLHALVLDRAQ
jgi:hypothetical protein